MYSPLNRIGMLVRCWLACSALALGAQVRPAPRVHGIMRPDPEQFRRWQIERKLAPQAAHAMVKLRSQATTGAPPASFTLLQSVPDYLERNQGDCGSCWVWASTALTEVALKSQFAITDRLSVQYFQSNNLALASCYGGDLTAYCDWYNNNNQSPANPNPGVLVPWSNAHGAYVDGTTTTFQTASVVPPGGVALQPQYSGLTLAHQTLDVGDPSVSQEQAIADIQAALLNNQAVGFSFETNFSGGSGFDAFWENDPESALWINSYEGVTVDWPYSGWGGHMVTIVGWDATDPNPANQYWIVLNQWGVTPTRPDQCFHLPMYMNYGATFTMVDDYGNVYPYACYAFETLTLATQGAASPAGPSTLAAGTLPLPSGPTLAGNVMTLVPAVTAGSPPFTYQWQANLGQGLQPVAGANAEALSLPNDVVPGYGILDSTWDGVQVALNVTTSAGSSVIGPVTVHVAGSILNADSGFEAGSGTSPWTWNDTPSSNPITQGRPTHGGAWAAALTGEGSATGSTGTLTSALVTLPADRTVPVLASYYLCTSTLEYVQLVKATCTTQVVDAAGNVLRVLKTHTDLDVDHLSYLPESFDITALNQGGTQVALQAVWSDPDGASLFLLDDAQILAGAAGTGCPAIAGFAPAGGVLGTPVVITGSHFTGASLVVFGRDYASAFTVDSDTQITAMAPWDGATGPITVTTPAGSASSAASFFMAPLFITDPNCLAFDLIYEGFHEMNPLFGAPQDIVQLLGFNFTGATSVTFNGIPATQFTVLNNSMISVTVPAGAQSGAMEVIAPGGVARTNGAFSVVAPAAPTLSLAAPAAASPEATVTLTGAGLATVNKVTFNGVSAMSFTVASDTTLTAVVPFGAGSGPIAVHNPIGTTSIPFTVLPPTIATISSNGPTVPGTAISVHGNGFLDATSLTIDGVATPFTLVSNTVVTAVIPPKLRPLASVPVVLTAMEGASAPFLFNVDVPAPVCSGIAPASGPAGTVITRTGQYFTDASAVTIGGVMGSSLQVVSDTQFTVVVPVNGVTGDVRVYTPFGTGTSATPFTVKAAAPVQVAITQAPDNLLEGASFSFSATVSGTATATVAWSVVEGAAGGSIDASGVYTAPAMAGQYHVMATSTADPTASSTAAVPVHSACLNPGGASGGPPTVVDLAYFMTAMGSKLGDSNYNPLADLNGDGVIDNADLALFLAAF